MKKITKARWINDPINGHDGKSLVFNYEGELGLHVLAQVWPASSTTWWMSLLGEDATRAFPSRQKAQAAARRLLLLLRERLQSL